MYNSYINHAHGSTHFRFNKGNADPMSLFIYQGDFNMTGEKLFYPAVFTEAEKAHINFSAVLQAALKEQLGV